MDPGSDYDFDYAGGNSDLESLSHSDGSSNDFSDDDIFGTHGYYEDFGWDGTGQLTIHDRTHLEQAEDGLGFGAGDDGGHHLDEDLRAGGGVEHEGHDANFEYAGGLDAEIHGEDEYYAETLPRISAAAASLLRAVPYRLATGGEDDERDLVPHRIGENQGRTMARQVQGHGGRPFHLNTDDDDDEPIRLGADHHAPFQLGAHDDDDDDDDDDVPFRLQAVDIDVPFRLEADNHAPFQLQPHVARATVRAAEVRQQLVSENEPVSAAQEESGGVDAYGGGQLEAVNNQSREENVKASSSKQLRIEGNESYQGGIDGWSCSICMDPWTNGGEHIACCLPCGHLYGMSCIKRWLQRQVPAKCPQCNVRCNLEDVRRLYLPQVAVVDDGLREKIMLLEAKCASLELKEAEWSRKEAEWCQMEVYLRQQLNEQKEGEKST